MRPVANPPNPWQSEQRAHLGEPPPALPSVYEERARSILARNDSPDLPFRWGCNPYRGCHHACAYCYARTTHQYLDWGAGTDFERRLVAKTNAPELLRAAFGRRSWRGERIAFSGVTDCYQPLEASYGLTRRCLEVCLAHRQPVTVITKGALVARDAELLGRLSAEANARVYLSIPFADDRSARALEPDASPVSARLSALRTLADAGVEVGVAVAPIIPGLTESHLPEILERAAGAGATHAFALLLRLPGEVADVFAERLREALPLRADKVLAAIRDVRGGALNASAFGARFVGEGARWEATAALFAAGCRRLGLSTAREDDGATPFRRPGGTASLF